MKPKGQFFIFILMLFGMYLFSQSGFDIDEFRQNLKMTKAEQKEKERLENKGEEMESYDGVFKVGDCVQASSEDYFKIVRESVSTYFYVLCQYEGGCTDTKLTDSRDDFEFTYNKSTIIGCP